jgi:hypothetical protein
MGMVKYSFPGRKWFPMLLLVFVLFTLSTGGFHRLWFFFGPLCLIFPFLFVLGIVTFVMTHGWQGKYSKRKNSDWFNGFNDEKPKRQADSDSKIFYL